MGEEKKTMTAEEYVVNRVKYLEAENRTLTNSIESLRAQVEAKRAFENKLIEILRKFMEVKSSTDGTKFIDAHYIWENYDKDAFSFLKKTVFWEEVDENDPF